MKLLPFLLVTLSLFTSSCAMGPTMRVHADGSITATTGGGLAARRKGVAATISTQAGGGLTLTYAVEDEDSGAVLNNYIGYKLVNAVAGFFFNSRNVVVAAQQSTARLGIKTAAQTEQARIAAEVTKSTFVPP